MAYEPKEGSGALFKNNKGDSPARPDYRGDLMVGGVVYEISAWIKPIAGNPEKRFMSMSAKPKQAQKKAAQRPTPAKQNSGFDDMGNDIPW